MIGYSVDAMRALPFVLMGLIMGVMVGLMGYFCYQGYKIGKYVRKNMEE